MPNAERRTRNAERGMARCETILHHRCCIRHFAFCILHSAIPVYSLCLSVALCVATLPADAAAGRDVRLVNAVKNRDQAAVRSLLKQNVDVNVPDAEGMTPLHWAAHWNDLETAGLLLSAGAHARVSNRYGVTPLHEACAISNVAMIEALLEAGADPDASYGDGETPLMTAARTGNVDAVKMLLTFGASVSAREAWRGQTALMWAAAENHAAVVKLLIELKADVNARSAHYQFPKLTGGNGGIIHDRSEGGLTPLFFAARQGATEAAAVLIEAGADMSALEPQYGFTAMQTAIFNGHYDFAAFLAGNGADVNDGSLYTAIEMRNLAAYSNRPNPPDTDKRLSSLDLVRLLLARGADPNTAYWKKIPPRQAQGDIVVPLGATPLYRAVKSIDLPAIRLLLESGADPSMAITDNSTPLMLASGLGARPRDGEEDLVPKADRADPLDAIKLFVDSGADVNAVNDAGNTAMHYAAQTGSTRIVEFLASKGAKLDIENYQGKTPLDLARGATAARIRKLMSDSPTRP
jgi:ankyrin repeat protein